MPKALFYIEGRNVPVQHIGCRLVVTKKLIHMGFEKGGAFNMPDGRVEVVLEGSKEELVAAHKEIKENLYEWLLDAAENRAELKKRLGNPGIGISDLELNESLLVLDIGLFSHSLTFDQIYKGVDVYKELGKQTRELAKANSELTEANSELAKAVKSLDKTLERKKN